MSELKPTEAQLDTLRHMLGINDPSIGNPRAYRNYAAVPPGDKRFAEMVTFGFVRKYRDAGDGCSYDYFETTDLGRQLAFESHKRRRYSKAKRVYSEYLRVADSLCDLTFRDFLTNPEFAETRRKA